MERTVSRIRHDLWWLAAGSLGMLLAATVGPTLATAGTPELRWSGILLIAALGGVTTAVVGPRVLPLAQELAIRGGSRLAETSRRLRPLTQGAAVGIVAAAVTAVGVSLFPDVLAPVEVRVGRGVPNLLLSQLQWAVPAAAVTGAVLGLTGWALVTQRDAVDALVGLLRRAGVGAHLAWGAALANLVASVLTLTVLSAGSAGTGTAATRAEAVLDAGAGWPLGWAAWGLASIGLLAVLILLSDRASPHWRPIAVASATVAVASDIVAVTLLGAALPALAPAAAAGDTQIFAAVERTALAFSGVAANGLYGVIGIALVLAAGRRLHPLVRVVGLAAFAAALVSGATLIGAPSWLTPAAGTSIALFVLFAFAFGWQLAFSRRAEPKLEIAVRRAARALVPLHPVPMVATVRDAVAVDLGVDPERLARHLPEALEPEMVDGYARVRLLAGTTTAARPGGLPTSLGLPATPQVILAVPLADGDAVTYLRSWGDDTFTSATTHWLTEVQLSRIQLEMASGQGRWAARGSAGSLQLELEEDPSLPGLDAALPATRATVERAGRIADIPLAARATSSRPARVVRLRIPFLEHLGAQPLGAAFLGDVEHRWGRARWRDLRSR